MRRSYRNCRHDKGINLHYNHLMDYDPRTGRYIQSDPVGFKGGLSAYAHVAGNSVSYVASNGLQMVILIPVPPSGASPSSDVKFPDLTTPVSGWQMWTFPDSILDRIDPMKTSSSIAASPSCIEQCYPILERPKKGRWDDSNTNDFHKCVAACEAAKSCAVGKK